MKEQLRPLDHRVLDSLRAEAPAPPEARARVRARLEAAIPAMRGRGWTSGGGRPGGGLSGASQALAVGAFLAGGLSGAALQAHWAKPPPAHIVYVDRVAPTPDPTASAAADLGSPQTPQAPPARTSAVEAPAAPARSSVGEAVVARAHARPAAAPHGSQLSAERILLDDARAALVRGEPERSLDGLERHRRDFPGGLLTEERDAMQVEALVRAGRFTEARARGGEFVRRTPESLFRPTVDAAIASVPPAPLAPAEASPR